LPTYKQSSLFSRCEKDERIKVFYNAANTRLKTL
jgi:hypothetical protein